MKILNRIYLTLALVFSVLGIVQCFRWHECSGTITIGYLFNFLPTGIFLIAYALGRSVRREVVHAIVIPLCLLGVGFWGFFTVIIEEFLRETTEVTNVRKYETILSDYWISHGAGNLVGHFPRPIPSDAEDVHFSFLPAFLQGGAHVQLRYRAAPAVISELYEQFSGEKTMSFTGGDINDHMNLKEGMPTTFFYTSGSKNHRFPGDYEIMIFDPVLLEADRQPGFYWNHGRSHGVAISKMRNEIVYWAESW